MKNGGDFVSLPAKKRAGKRGYRPCKDETAIPPFSHSRRCHRRLPGCFVVTGGGYHYYYAQAALISVDVNPSIELTVNRLDRNLFLGAQRRWRSSALGHPADRHGVRGSGKNCCNPKAENRICPEIRTW